MRNLFFFSLLLTSAILHAQKKGEGPKFTKITPEDLKKNVYSIDSNANAVVLYDFGASEIEGNDKGWFSLKYNRHKRVHILKKAGYYQGDVEVSLYVDGTEEEKLTSVKGITYNLENDKIVETKLEKSAIFTDKQDKNHIVKKFTLPNIKEGSIIDIEYTTSSDFLFNLEPWNFQGSAPRLWSEYKVSIPEFLGYVFLNQGYQPLYINEKKDRREMYTITDTRGTSASERTHITAGVTDYRWVMKDVPELKEEGFTSTLSNHLSKIEFQLAEYRYPLTQTPIMRTWAQATKELMEREDFGKHLTANNGWMSDDIKPILANTSNKLEKAKKLYAFVRDNIACTNIRGIRTTQTLKNVLKSKKGSVSELNLLLTAMLRHEGFDASPVILSTREHGYAYELYPIMNRFNYVVCQVSIDDKTYFLDASHSRLGFGKMPYECYNGWARIVNEAASSLALMADSLNERKVSSLFLMDNAGKWTGTFSQQLGYYESLELREKVKEQGQDAIFKGVQKGFGDVKTEATKIDSLDNYEVPLSLKYSFAMNLEGEDILYINPLFGEAQKENPFKSAERLYPVELPYNMDETYVATIYVPAGYEVEELPKQIMVRLNEQNEGFFEYAIGLSGNVISLRTRVKISRTYFAPQEYEMLREFFNLIVKKQSEQIVFKKKK